MNPRRVRGVEPRSPRAAQPEGAGSMYLPRFSLTLAALTAAGALLATPPARAAFLPLPATGAQVNDDPSNSIDPTRDAGVSDVVGGAVTAGKPTVPWAPFEQKVGADQQHIFVRAFKN